ncbi:YcbK family protein [Muricoccus radiodurans]|uniref:YcbK family protein n=1 Tax=Muricoccus radiodurans TaxID=2231721 RepID=UPI003CF03F1C
MIRVLSGGRPHAPECPCCEAARLGRRSLIGGMAALLACTGIAEAQVGGGTRRIAVRRAYTDDGFSGVYFSDGRYQTEALRRLDWVFRDLRREEVTPMDPRLFDVMHAVATRMEATEPFEVISGYRSPETNAANAARSRRVSTVSLHMSGMAGDMRVPGRDSYAMARLAASMGLGGVGLYRRDGFVHLDCGQSRRW